MNSWTSKWVLQVQTPDTKSALQSADSLSPDWKSRLLFQVRKPSLDSKFDYKLLFCTAEVKSEVQTPSLRLLSSDYKSRLHVHTESLTPQTLKPDSKSGLLFLNLGTPSEDFRYQVQTLDSKSGLQNADYTLPCLESQVNA